MEAEGVTFLFLACLHCHYKVESSSNIWSLGRECRILTPPFPGPCYGSVEECFLFYCVMGRLKA